LQALDVIYQLIDTNSFDSSVMQKKEYGLYLRTLNILAYTYKKQADYEEALKFFNKLTEIYKQIVEFDSSKYTGYLIDIADIYQLQGKEYLASKLYRLVLEIDEQTIGIEHPDYAVHLNKLGKLYYKQGSFKDAVYVLTQMLLILEANQPKNYLDIETVKKNLEHCKKLINDEFHVTVLDFS
jgi:tetratricopeptide (TPR) repeat protein